MIRRLVGVGLGIAVATCVALTACRKADPSPALASLPSAITDEMLPSPPALELSREMVLPAAPSAPDSAPVLLRYRANLGDSIRYQLQLDQKIVHSGPSLPRSESAVEQTLTVTETVEEATPDTLVFRATVSAVRVSFEPDVPDLVEAARQALEGLRYTYRESRRGQITDVRPSEDANPSHAAAFRALSSHLRQAAFVLPGEPVARGAQWTHETADLTIPIGDKSAIPASVVTRYTLKGTTQVDDRQLAVIEVDVRQSLSGTLQEGSGTAELIGGAKGSGVVLFDIAAGQVARSELVLGALQVMRVQGTEQVHLLEQRQTLRLRRGPEQGATPGTTPSTTPSTTGTPTTER